MGGFPFRALDLHATAFPVQVRFLQLESPDIHHARTVVRESTHIRGMRPPHHQGCCVSKSPSTARARPTPFGLNG